MEVTKLYNDKVELKFDKDKHIYTVNGEIIFGVTSATGILDKPALMYWAVNQALGFLDKALKPGMVIDELNKPKLLAEAKSIHRKKKEEAADIGTAVHNYLEVYLNTKINNLPPPTMPINEQVNKGIQAFIEWENEHNVKFLSSERKIYSKKYKYAGTLDGEAEINGNLSIIDFKTSKRFYDEHFIQTSAYAKAIEEEDNVKIRKCFVIRFPKDGSEFGVIEDNDIDMHFESFLGCLTNYKRIRYLKTQEIKEYKKNLKK